MTEEVKRNYLEINSLKDLIEGKKPTENYSLNLIDPINFQLNRFSLTVKNWRRIGAIIGSIGCIEFVIFSTIAMFFYGRGTSWDKSAEGYTFWHNVLSDLGRTISYSGVPNTVSSPMFNVALSFFGICIMCRQICKKICRRSVRSDR